MDKYLSAFREMISLRGLTAHTVRSYSTYISAYLNYLTDILHKQPEDVSWDELRDFIRWLQRERNLSDRTINACISQLRYEDISRSSMRIHIRSSKNRSDRFAILSKNALDILTQYWFQYGRPDGFLFPNRDHPDRPMASFTVNQFIAAKENELGWEHRFSCHTFRHAFGTHLYENGTDLHLIQ